MPLRLHSLTFLLLSAAPTHATTSIAYPGCAITMDANIPSYTSVSSSSFHIYRQRKVSGNPDLIKLNKGIPIEIKAKDGKALRATLKGFWFRNLPYTDSIKQANSYVQKFRPHIQKIYKNDHRMNLPAHILPWVDWEDFYFYEHLGWVFIEDLNGTLLSALKIYSFDYELAYLGKGRLDNEKQIALPVERKAHILHFAQTEFEKHFSYPSWSVPEHEELRRELIQALGPRSPSAFAREAYADVGPKALTQVQIDQALAIHRRLQVAELSRYIRTEEAPAGFDFMPALAHGTAILLPSENIQLAKIEALTVYHRSFYGRRFQETVTIPINTGEGDNFRPVLFNATLEAITNIARSSDYLMSQ